MNYCVVIPSKTYGNMAACIKAIRAAHETCPICVIDDGMIPGPIVSAGYWRIAGEKPFVYARNCNIGIRDIEGDVILLNDDALLVSPGGFGALATAAERNPEYGIIGAATNCTGNPDQWPRPYMTGLRETRRCVPFICVYIPRRTINLVGFLDERFTAYGYEDQDYCRRVRNAGLKVGILDACFVDHESLTSTFRGEPHTAGILEPGRKIYLDKWGDLD